MMAVKMIHTLLVSAAICSILVAFVQEESKCYSEHFLASSEGDVKGFEACSKTCIKKAAHAISTLIEAQSAAAPVDVRFKATREYLSLCMVVFIFALFSNRSATVQILIFAEEFIRLAIRDSIRIWFQYSGAFLRNFTHPYVKRIGMYFRKCYRYILYNPHLFDLAYRRIVCLLGVAVCCTLFYYY